MQAITGGVSAGNAGNAANELMLSLLHSLSGSPRLYRDRLLQDYGQSLLAHVRARAFRLAVAEIHHAYSLVSVEIQPNAAGHPGKDAVALIKLATRNHLVIWRGASL